MMLALRPATEADLSAVARLMNVAFRSRGANAGWSTEADYITGNRTNETALREDLASKPGAAMLLLDHADGLQACVWLEPVAEATWYLGSLTVDPRLQNAGMGRQLLAAAEQWAHDRGARTIRMTVVNVRDTLIAWYERRGYHLTGETRPFPYGDERFGKPQRDDLGFVVLAKPLVSCEIRPDEA